MVGMHSPYEMVLFGVQIPLRVGVRMLVEIKVVRLLGSPTKIGKLECDTTTTRSQASKEAKIG
jgi:hypothetical protein